jgi:hypothetical protein
MRLNPKSKIANPKSRSYVAQREADSDPRRAAGDHRCAGWRDGSPLLAEPGEPVVFVLSQPQNDWTACFSSLDPDAEWTITEALALGLEQPAIYALFSDDTGTYAYRYFEDGVLHEELLPDQDDSSRIDSDSLIERLMTHGVPLDLIDDRTINFGADHVLVGYGHARA